MTRLLSTVKNKSSRRAAAPLVVNIVSGNRVSLMDCPYPFLCHALSRARFPAAALSALEAGVARRAAAPPPEVRFHAVQTRVPGPLD
jgi:hypothetical protein